MHSPTEIVLTWLHWFGDRSPVSVGAFVGVSALTEHLFPPYPGDVAVALGAALGVHRRWPWPALYACAIAGSFLGTLATFYFGRWISKHGPLHTNPRALRFHAVVEPIALSLEKRGIWMLVVARFVPIGRALAVVAAGYAGMHARRAISAAMLGAALWHGVLFLVGALLGHNLPRIQSVLQTYSRVVAIVVVAALIAWVATRWFRARRGTRAP